MTARKRYTAAADEVTPLDEEVRHGRNFIRRGDVVRFQLKPGGRWIAARFIGAGQAPSGRYYLLVDDRHATRHVRPARVKRTTKAVAR